MKEGTSRRAPLVATLACVLAGGVAHAKGDVAVSDAWVRLVPGEGPMAGYFVLSNDGEEPKELVGAESDAFGKTMLHRTVSGHGMTRMMDVEKVTIPGTTKIEFMSRGYHLMLMEPGDSLKEGGEVPVMLKFADGEEVKVNFEVKKDAGAPVAAEQ